MHIQSCACHDIKHDTDTLCKKKKDTALSELSERDVAWDKHKAQCDDVADIYRTTYEFERLAARMNECSGVLKFSQEINDDGEFKLKLKRAQFCRVRNCPNCNWRRSMMWKARFYEALPIIMKSYPKARWLFLTLTVRNCDITDLRETIQYMGKSWSKLTKRKEFGAIKGWLRTTELTRGKDGSAHPHFHCLLMVQPSFFAGKNYIKKERWIELWQSCLKANYKPNLDIRTVKNIDANDQKSGLEKAISETLKYTVKPSDMTADKEWFLEMTNQVHQLRFIASGGALKDVLKEDNESDDDMMLKTQEEDEENEHLLAFSWRKNDRKYRRSKKFDV